MISRFFVFALVNKTNNVKPTAHRKEKVFSSLFLFTCRRLILIFDFEMRPLQSCWSFPVDVLSMFDSNFVREQSDLVFVVDVTMTTVELNVHVDEEQPNSIELELELELLKLFVVLLRQFFHRFQLFEPNVPKNKDERRNEKEKTTMSTD